MPVAEKYTNMAYLSVTESAANTLTFSKLETGIAPFEKRAWLISRLEYLVTIDATKFAATNDLLDFGLSVSNAFTTPSPALNEILDFNEFKRVDFGAAATGTMFIAPFVKDYSTVMGGGLLVPPNPIYAWAQGSSLGAAASVYTRMYYVSVDLKTDEFWELVEMRRMIGT